jgi:hypothetical protein
LFFNFVNNSCFCFPLFPCSDLFGFVLQFWLIVGLICCVVDLILICILVCGGLCCYIQ